MMYTLEMLKDRGDCTIGSVLIHITSPTANTAAQPTQKQGWGMLGIIDAV
jgi:hypothetical protein